MTCVYESTKRPARTAGRAREIWDAVTAEDGAPPQSIKLLIDEGGFRDWMFIRANGELDTIEAGLVGVPHRRG
jgi:hypothetical protein